ncbi:cytochrome P450 [Auriculariales sp. MPI-PUGE-AT-0066]|nr:cytochrome P450 [Auriculariales sp. MPI-PUGE-AT-0066]
MFATLWTQCEILSRESVAGLAAAVTTIWLLGRWISSRRDRRAFPPGPPGLPVIGNLLDMPNVKEWLVYAEWARKYGDIVGVQMPGMSIVFLNKEEDAKALFAARSGNYSDRAVTPMLRLGWDTVIGVTDTGNVFRALRRLFFKFLGPQAIKKTTAVQEKIIREAIVNLIHKPGDVQSHLKLAIGKLVLRLAYGYDMLNAEDPMLHWVDVALEAFLQASRPNWTINFFPFLQYLPSWLPGMGFKKIASEYRTKSELSHDVPFNWVKEQIAAGTAQPSFALQVLSDPDLAVDEAIVKEVLNNLYIAGADTIIATFSWFLSAMCLFPDVQRRAREEIDRLTGGTRLPCLDDRPSLPYLEALFKEVLRWNVVTNIGMLNFSAALPHVSLAEDVYKGYCFPKGTVFMANVWSIMHDSNKYPDPFDFRPERFLDQHNGENNDGVEVNEDPNHFAFGFGIRQLHTIHSLTLPRICPGRHFADSVVWNLMAHILAACEISKAEYPDGTAITANNIDYTSGIVSSPLPFTCNVAARSEQTEALLVE